MTQRPRTEALAQSGRPADAAETKASLAPRAAPAPPRSIFGSNHIHDKVLGTVSCPNCNKRISYRLRDIGSRPLCPACHCHTLRIGESLLEGGRRSDADGEPTKDPPAILLFPRMRWRWHHALPLALAAGALLVATSAPVPQEKSEGRVPAGTIAIRASQREGDPDGDGVVAPASPPAEITPEAITELLGWDDALAALQQAESWQQVLRDYGIADSDARMGKLAEVIERLRQRTKVPPTPPPPCIAEFRKELQSLRDALKAKNVAAAKVALERLEQLFREHQEDLAHYGRSLLTLKARFDQLVRIQEGPATIRRLLDRATHELERDQATPAAESIAKAKFLTLGMPLKEEDFALIDKEVRQIERELRFVRGKVAVAAAEECLNLRDALARDAMVRLALDLLPDLPASRVRDLTKQARELESKPIAKSEPSPRGQTLIYRAAYEDALQFYGRDKKLQELTDACGVARKYLEAVSDPGGQEARKLADLVFTALEFAVGNLADRPTTAPDVPGRLSEAKNALEKAAPWRGSPRWVAVQGTIAAKEEEIGRAAVKRAQEYAAKGDYQRASEVITPAFNLGSPPSRQRAASLAKQWEHLGEQQKSWQDIQNLVAEGKTLDAWAKFRAFEERFPDFSKDKVEAFRKELQPQAIKAVKLLIEQAETQMARKEWVGFRQSVEQLQSLHLRKTDQLARFDSQLERLDAEAEELYQQAKSNRLAGTSEQVATLLERLSEIMAKNPNHPEAGPWYRQLKARAQRTAGSMLRTLRLASYKGSEYRSKLELVKRLDPDGELGAEAEKLLSEAAKNE